MSWRRPVLRKASNNPNRQPHVRAIMNRMGLIPGADSPALKGFRDGTHRLVAPEETVARARPFLPEMGITRIANVTGLDRIGIPVVMVCRPNSRTLAVAQGKGLDLAAAKASGLMESIETYHAERITLPLVMGSYEELLPRYRLADVDQLPRPTWSRFHPNLPLLWIEGYDLLQEEPVWVPYELVHTNYTLEMQVRSGNFVASSNGLASGNNLLEAISHAICEVVERDAAALDLLKGEAALQEARIDLDTVTDPACREVLERYERAGVDVAVWEITSDVGISAFKCLISERDENPLRRLYSAEGMGCHPCRPIALLRALTEAAQSRLTAISGSRDDTFREHYESLRSPELLKHNRAVTGVNGFLRRFDDGPTFSGATFDEDVAWELALLREVGIRRVVAVDLTRPEFNVPVVRVVIPGMESFCREGDDAPGARARAFAEAQT
jgi:YcaO-like protein with predicted kinase domain